MAGTSRHPTPPTPRRPTPRWPPARARELPLPEQERKPKALPFLRRAVRAALRHPPGARSASPRHLHPRLPLTSALNVGPRRRPCRPQLTPLRRQNGGYPDLRSCFESFENRVWPLYSVTILEYRRPCRPQKPCLRHRMRTALAATLWVCCVAQVLAHETPSRPFQSTDHSCARRALALRCNAACAQFCSAQASARKRAARGQAGGRSPALRTEWWWRGTLSVRVGGGRSGKPARGCWAAWG